MRKSQPSPAIPQNIMKPTILSGLLLCAFATGVAAQSPIIFIVRHAERADSHNGSSMSLPNDPGLSDAGRARAEALSTLLKDAGITAIYATEYQRTQQTAAPLVRIAGVRVSIVPGKETASLVTKLKQEPGHVLVIAHSNTIPEILKGLGVMTPVTIGESDYDNLFVVINTATPQWIRLHYH
jgi:phosphohistidine phosphatase SixA